jgi:hypothetical protein
LANYTLQSSGDTTVISYPSWFSLVDTAHEASKKLGDSAGLQKELPSGWYGSKTFDVAFKLADQGWEEGARSLGTAGDALFDEMAGLIKREEYFYDNEPGIEVDPVLYGQGDPDCWIHSDAQIKRGTSKSIFRLVFNASCSSGVGTEIIMARGVITAAMVMLLTKAGMNIEVVAFFGISENNEKRLKKGETRGFAAESYVTVKHADQHIDAMTLAYALAHPSTFRRFALTTFDALLKDDQRDALSIPGYYGYPCEASHQGDVYIPAAHAADAQWCLDPKTARQWILALIKDQGMSLTGMN